MLGRVMKQTIQNDPAVVQDYLDKLMGVLIQSNPNPDYQSGNGGSGILTVGGGKYWPGIVVMVKLLRELGCNVPVEIWYRGECETIYPEDFYDGTIQQYAGIDCIYSAKYNVRMIDIDQRSTKFDDSRIKRGDVAKGGWEAKLYAIYHTALTHVLYLDADAYCVSDPSPLFDLVKDKGFVYWQDLPNQQRSVKWDNVFPDGPANVMQVQGGQLLVNRETAWRLIHLCHYMCQHSDYYFRYMYGDQDTWRVGLAVLSKHDATVYLNIGKAEWRGVAFVCAHAGVDYIIHRCQGKLYAVTDIPHGKQRYTNPQNYLPQEGKVFAILAETLNSRQIDASTVFSSIYDKKLWGGGSGSGSSIKEVTPFLNWINKFISDRYCTSLVDVGCGDAVVGSAIKVDQYIGLDCCPKVIRNNTNRYKNKKFFPLDIYAERGIISVCDILLIKDVFHHWPNEWVMNWLESLTQSNLHRFIICCQDEQGAIHGADCHVGGYRPINLGDAPFDKFGFKKVFTYLHKAVYVHEQL